MQRALMMASDGPVGARADYLHAMELTDGLGPRDAAILKGLGPCVLTEPTDFRACTAALLPLHADYPRDARDRVLRREHRVDGRRRGHLDAPLP